MKRAIFLIPMLAIGCSQTPQGGSPGQEKVNFQDVPMPGALTYDAGYGHSTASGHIRVYTQELSGPMRPEEVAKWYREKLPVHGWTVAADDGKKLRFHKKEEQCDVEIASATHGVKVKVSLNYKK